MAQGGQTAGEGGEVGVLCKNVHKYAVTLSQSRGTNLCDPLRHLVRDRLGKQTSIWLRHPAVAHTVTAKSKTKTLEIQW